MSGIYGPFKLHKKKYLHYFCRKKPAGIFRTFLFSIRISQQLLCQKYKWPAYLNLLNFIKRNIIYTTFAEKGRPAFSKLFCSPFGFRNCNNINVRHFMKKAGRNFGNFSILNSDFESTFKYLRFLPFFP